MEHSKVYFRDNFFSSGVTEIFDADGQQIGELDLISMFSSGVEVRDGAGNTLYSGRFPFFSNRWEITDSTGNVVGELRKQLTFLSKRYEYNAFDRGVYSIESEAFSSEYVIFDESETEAAIFQKVNTWLEPAAFELSNETAGIPTQEWIMVVMGVNAIQRRERNRRA